MEEQAPKTKGHGLAELLKCRQVQKKVVGGGGRGVHVTELDDRHSGSCWGARHGSCPSEAYVWEQTGRDVSHRSKDTEVSPGI